MSYQLKRGPFRRKNGPCPECASERCRSMSSFACWVRAFRQALDVHGFVRCGPHSKLLRAAGIPVLLGPQPQGNEVVFAPDWAVLKVTALREQSWRDNSRLRSLDAATILQADSRYGPPPAALLDRLDELRAFAVLRGWRMQYGTWSR